MKSTAMTILLFHGSRLSSTLEEARAMVQNLTREFPDQVCSVAFLQFAKPSLEEVVERAVEQGTSVISVFPLFVLTGTHVEEDIPALIAGFREKFPDVTFSLIPHLGHDPSFLEWLGKKIKTVS